MLFLKTYEIKTEDQVISPLDGWQYIYPPFPGTVQVAVLYGGGTVPDTKPNYDFVTGSDSIAQGAEAVFKGTQDPPTVQDVYDYNLKDVVNEGERLGMTLRIPGVASAAGSVLVAVQLMPG